MTDPYMAQIQIFPYTFAPRGWAICEGQLLSIVQNTALFSLIGTTYGGDGRSTFGLPQMRPGRVPLSYGQSNTGSYYDLGESAGVDSVTLQTGEMAQHTHRFYTSGGLATERQPVNQLYAIGSGLGQYTTTTTPQVTMAIDAVKVTGQSYPHNNLMSYLGINYCIALEGVYPARPAGAKLFEYDPPKAPEGEDAPPGDPPAPDDSGG